MSLLGVLLKFFDIKKHEKIPINIKKSIDFITIMCYYGKVLKQRRFLFVKMLLFLLLKTVERNFFKHGKLS